MSVPAGSQQSDQLAGLEEKIRENDATVTEIQVAIKAATGADVPPGDIHALLADYSSENIMEKIQLMGNMGQQELRNVPGLLVYLLKDDSGISPAGPGQGQGRA